MDPASNPMLLVVNRGASEVGLACLLPSMLDKLADDDQFQRCGPAQLHARGSNLVCNVGYGYVVCLDAEFNRYFLANPISSRTYWLPSVPINAMRFLLSRSPDGTGGRCCVIALGDWGACAVGILHGHDRLTESTLRDDKGRFVLCVARHRKRIVGILGGFGFGYEKCNHQFVVIKISPDGCKLEMLPLFGLGNPVPKDLYLRGSDFDTSIWNPRFGTLSHFLVNSDEDNLLFIMKCYRDERAQPELIAFRVNPQKKTFERIKGLGDDHCLFLNPYDGMVLPPPPGQILYEESERDQAYIIEMMDPTQPIGRAENRDRYYYVTDLNGRWLSYRLKSKSFTNDTQLLWYLKPEGSTAATYENPPEPSTSRIQLIGSKRKQPD